MSYKVTIKLEREVRTNGDEQFEVRTEQRPTKRQLRSKWGEALVLTGVAGSQLSVPWRHIRSVQVTEEK